MLNRRVVFSRLIFTFVLFPLTSLLAAPSADKEETTGGTEFGPAIQPLIVMEAADGTVESVQKLLDSGSSTEASNEDMKVTPLIAAAHAGNLKVVEFLIERGANVGAVDAGGKTALHWAALRDHAEVVGVLIKSGADVNAVDDSKATSVSLAARTGSVDALKLLLSSDEIDLNTGDVLGVTPLMWATIRNQEAIVRLLLEVGVDATKVSESGLTAGDYAEFLGFTEVLKILDQKRSD